MRRRPGLAVAGCVGEGVLEQVQPAFLVRVVEPCRGELVDLVAQQVDLASPLARRATERRQLGVELGEPGTGRSQRPQVDVAEAVEGGALGRRAEQALVVVLAVQVDQAGGGVGERTDRRRPAVDVRPGPALGGHDARQHELGVTGDEAAVDAGLLGAWTHHGRVGAATDEQFERLDEHRLARSGLPGHRGQPGAQREVHPLDHAEVLDVQLGEHQGTPGCAGRSPRRTSPGPDARP